MINLHENEKVLAVIRKHWFVMARAGIVLSTLLALPIFILFLLPALTVKFDPELVGILTNFFLSLYVNFLIGFLFLAWMDYYLDMWVITNERIIDAEQHGLFHREISEIPLSRVQDVTVEVEGIIETLLKFGTIKIQTAGERGFSITNVPRLQELKDLILRQVKGVARADV